MTLTEPQDPQRYRQAKPANVITGELPWWAKAPRENFTAAALERLPQMSASPEARLVSGITVGQIEARG